MHLYLGLDATILFTDQILLGPQRARACFRLCPFLFTDVAKLVLAHACYVIATVVEGDKGVAALAPLPSLKFCKLDELRICVETFIMLTLSIVRKMFAEDTKGLGARYARDHRALAAAEAKKLIKVHEVRADRIGAVHFVCHGLFAQALANQKQLIFVKHDPE